MVGLLVKKTRLEVKTEYDYNKGIRFTNKFYDSTPISLFNIFLDNHRMIYTTNQKGSPDIRSFSATIKYVLREYVQLYNIDKDKRNKMSYPSVDVVNLPLFVICEIKSFIVNMYHCFNMSVFSEGIEMVKKINNEYSNIDISSKAAGYRPIKK